VQDRHKQNSFLGLWSIGVFYIRWLCEELPGFLRYWQVQLPQMHVDGQRSVASSAVGLVDTNTFPQSLVERIEVVSGGASSAYGSDAIAGVVNFILDKDYTGVKTAYEVGNSDYSKPNERLKFTLGNDFAGGQGHFLFSTEYYGDTETQAMSIFAKFEASMAELGVGFGDIVKMTVFLVGDPALDGQMDFAGFMRAYSRFFGTQEQPNKPARSAIQIAGLAGGPNMLIEIEAVIARP
jgi:enamine deaminase RidA (YjgF/YER057c/UK114 family)